MAIDPYTMCPGGTGKKLKFCCSDLTAELDKLERLVQGQQRQAALEFVTKCEEKFANRPCLMAARIQLEEQLDRDDDMAATIARFRATHPENPIGLAEESLQQAVKGDMPAAARLMNQAVIASQPQMVISVYHALGGLAQILLSQGFVEAGLAQLRFQTAIGAESDQQPAALLMQVLGQPSLPLLLKEDRLLRKTADGSPIAPAVLETIQLADTGRWVEAVDRFAALAQQHPDVPEVWYNLSVLRAWLADTEGEVEALRRYARLPVALEDAVEAEARAQLVGGDNEADTIDILEVEFPVRDPAELDARLSDRRIVRMQVDPAPYVEKGDVPPKAGYSLLDRAPPASSANLTVADVPTVLAQIYVFGRETDREARAQLVSFNAPESAGAQAEFAQLAGDAVGQPGEPKTVGQMAALQHAMSFNWRFPDDATPEQRQKLIEQQQSLHVRQRWPSVRLGIFGGQTAREAAAEPALRVPVLAALLLLELSDSRVPSTSEFNDVRRDLGLPLREPFELGERPIADVPLTRLALVVVEKLSDDALLSAFRRSAALHYVTAGYRLAHEMLRRDSIKDKIDRANLYGYLATVEHDPDEVRKLYGQARQAAKAAGKPTAQWDLRELQMLVAIVDVEAASRLLDKISQENQSQPQVFRAALQILAEAGWINPDGSLPMLQGVGPQSSLVMPGETAGGGGSQLWTPGGDTGGEKKTLWTPGMG